MFRVIFVLIWEQDRVSGQVTEPYPVNLSLREAPNPPLCFFPTGFLQKNSELIKKHAELDRLALILSFSHFTHFFEFHSSAANCRNWGKILESFFTPPGPVPTLIILWIPYRALFSQKFDLWWEWHLLGSCKVMGGASWLASVVICCPKMQAVLDHCGSTRRHFQLTCKEHAVPPTFALFAAEDYNLKRISSFFGSAQDAPNSLALSSRLKHIKPFPFEVAIQGSCCRFVPSGRNPIFAIGLMSFDRKTWPMSSS